MQQQGNMYLINACIAMIQQYILEHKGVIVNIRPPYGPEQEKLFIKALDVACIYYDKQL